MNERKPELSKILIEQTYSNSHSKYGRFIIQTNYVQSLLVLLVLSRSRLRNEKLKKHLSSLMFGNLIGHFRVCVKNNPLEAQILNSLNKYKKSRDALAHKMITSEGLTEKECELAIKLGDILISELDKLLNKELA